jgi:hypothetical protein
LKVKLKPVGSEPSEIITYYDLLDKYKVESPYEEPETK